MKVDSGPCKRCSSIGFKVSKASYNWSRAQHVVRHDTKNFQVGRYALHLLVKLEMDFHSMCGQSTEVLDIILATA